MTEQIYECLLCEEEIYTDIPINESPDELIDHITDAHSNEFIKVIQNLITENYIHVGYRVREKEEQ